MKMKCNICGKEVGDDELIHAPKRKVKYYFCIECYKKSKYYKVETFNTYLEETQKLLKEKKETKELMDFIKKNIGIPDSWLMKKKYEINNGKYGTKQYPQKLISFKISDVELLDMFKRMEIYLKKASANIEPSNKTHYCLAIVYNSYPKYLEHLKKVKETQNHNISDDIDISDDLLEKANTNNEDKISYDIEF